MRSPSRILIMATVSLYLLLDSVSFAINRGSNLGAGLSGLSRVAFCTKQRAVLNIRGGEIQEVETSEDIQAIIDDATGRLVVVEFTSKDCAPCKLVGPLYMELSESDEFESVLFLKVDVDEHPDIATEYQVTGWPAFLFIKNGDVQTEIVGGKLAQATLYDWVKLLMPK